MKKRPPRGTIWREGETFELFRRMVADSVYPGHRASREAPYSWQGDYQWFSHLRAKWIAEENPVLPNRPAGGFKTKRREDRIKPAHTPRNGGKRAKPDAVKVRPVKSAHQLLMAEALGREKRIGVPR